MEKIMSGPARTQKVQFKYKLINYKGHQQMHADFASVMPEVEELQFGPMDILECSFPKSGRTWLETILTLMLNDGNPESLKELNSDQFKTFAYMEARYTAVPDHVPQDWWHGEVLKDMPTPKLAKTHLPWALLPQSAIEKKSKIIFIYRNVKDVMLSFYYHNVYSPSKLHDNLGCFEDFVKDMMEDRVAQCPYFAHLHGYWIHRTDSNVLFLSYEQMLKDHVGVINMIASFLDLKLSDEQAENIRFQSTLEQMKAIDDETWREMFTVKDAEGAIVHSFIRTGKAGTWRTQFSPELNTQVDAWIQRNLKVYNFDSDPFQQ